MRRCFSPLPLLHPSSHPCSVIPVKKSAHYPLDWLRHQHPIASNCGEKKKTAPELVGRTYEKKRAKSLNVINPATRLVGRQCVCVCVYRVNGLPWRPEPWVCRDRDVSELPPPPPSGFLPVLQSCLYHWFLTQLDLHTLNLLALLSFCVIIIRLEKWND